MSGLDQLLMVAVVVAAGALPFLWRRLPALITIPLRSGGLVSDGDLGLADLYSQITFGRLCELHRLIEVNGPEKRTVGEFDALQVEAVMIVANHFVFKYLHTSIAGHRCFHRVIVWSTQSLYDRALFDRLIDGFRERPGPLPPVVAPPGETFLGSVH